MTSPSSAARPLSGIRVLDLSRVLSGPHCTRMLADMGADVIKIEPPAGDLTRFAMPRRHGLSSYFVQQNVGKRNVSLDLATADGAEILLALAEHADVLVENYRPGVMGRLGLDADTVRPQPEADLRVDLRVRPDRPVGGATRYAPVVEAESGIIASQTNARGGELAKDPHSHADVYAALETTSAILAALYQREHTGVGQWIDVSMAETMLYVNEHLHDALWEGDDDPQWIRSFRPGDYLVLTVANGESLVVSGHPAERGTFHSFLAAMERQDLADDPRFADVAARLANFDELREIIREFAASVPDAVAFEELFSKHQLAVGRVRQPGELTETDWAHERHAVVEVDDRGGGTIRVPNVPWRFSASPDIEVSGVPKYRGEDNRQILAELLGYDADRLDELESDGVLSSRMPGDRTP